MECEPKSWEKAEMNEWLAKSAAIQFDGANHQPFN